MEELSTTKPGIGINFSSKHTPPRTEKQQNPYFVFSVLNFVLPMDCENAESVDYEQRQGTFLLYLCVCYTIFARTWYISEYHISKSTRSSG